MQSIKGISGEMFEFCPLLHVFLRSVVCPNFTVMGNGRKNPVTLYFKNIVIRPPHGGQVDECAIGIVRRYQCCGITVRIEIQRRTTLQINAVP